ncbi:hypothetical protein CAUPRSCDRAFT_13061 [Caulochytrium protostelioides]|nr:hypothetical protein CAUPRSCDRAFT_13061 [Caulochytrium protostelioides]
MYLRDVANHTFPVMDPVSRSGSVRYLFWALRFVWGVGLLFGWRLMAKHICYTLLPPLYRVLARALPFRRKFFHLARDYGGIPAEHITFFPSVLYLNAHTASDPHTYKLPRYDVDIATKLIVYTGIGWLATMVIPLVNERLNL